MASSFRVLALTHGVRRRFANITGCVTRVWYGMWSDQDFLHSTLHGFSRGSTAIYDFCMCFAIHVLTRLKRRRVTETYRNIDRNHRKWLICNPNTNPEAHLSQFSWQSPDVTDALSRRLQCTVENVLSAELLLTSLRSLSLLWRWTRGPDVGRPCSSIHQQEHHATI